MQFANLNNMTIHYSLSGNPANTPLVFVNSMGTDLRVWDLLLPYLEDNYFAIRYDKRGHGLSSCPPSPYTISDFSNDLAALIDHLEIDEFCLTGISIGGQIAMQYALDHPGKVTSLILADTAAKIGSNEFWQQRIEAIREKGLPVMAQEIVPRWFAPNFPEEAPATYDGFLHMLSRTSQEGYIGTCEALAEADLREAVKDLPIDTLVLCGADDQATLPDMLAEFTAALPNARFAEIPHAGHHPCIENPQQMAMAMKAFIREKVNA